MERDVFKTIGIIFSLFLMYGCASTPAYKDPNVVYLDEIKVTTQESITHVGIFADKKFEYTIEQASDPVRLVMDIQDADSTYLNLPKVPEDNVILDSISKEQTFNDKGLPTTRITMNLRTEAPFEAVATKYGARIAITATDLLAEGPELPSEEMEVAEAETEAPSTGEISPDVDDADELAQMNVDELSKLESPETYAEKPTEEMVKAPKEEVQKEESSAVAQGPRVVGLDVLEMDNAHRFVITTDSPVSLTKQEEPNLFKVQLSNTSISEKLVQRIDLSQFDSSIKDIMPRVEDSTVSFDIALKDDVRPSLSQQDKIIYIDVPRPGLAVIPRPMPVKAAPQVAARPAGQYYGELINLDVSNAQMKDVVQMISKNSGVNIVSGADVKGRVSAHLHQVPWDQALDVVLRSHNLGYVQEGNTIRVASLDTLRAEEGYGPFEDVVLPLSFSKANDVEKRLSMFVSKHGKLSVDERTNSLIIRDLPLQVAKMINLVKQIDKDLPAILIEVQFVEATGQFSKELGIKWAGTASTALEALVGDLSGKGDLYTMLYKAEDDKLAKVVASPKVTTLVNHEVTIGQGSDLAYAVQGGVGFRPLDVSLKILPRLSRDKSILLSVDMIREYPRFFSKKKKQSIFIGGGSFGNAGIGRETTKTELKLSDGETTVLSWTFPSEDDNDRELLVFLTPRLL